MRQHNVLDVATLTSESANDPTPALGTYCVTEPDSLYGENVTLDTVHEARTGKASLGNFRNGPRVCSHQSEI